MNEFKILKGIFLAIAIGAGIGFAGRFIYQLNILNYDVVDLLPTLTLAIVFVLSIPVIYFMDKDVKPCKVE